MYIYIYIFYKNWKNRYDNSLIKYFYIFYTNWKNQFDVYLMLLKCYNVGIY
jgi:hypothetical protein